MSDAATDEAPAAPAVRYPVSVDCGFCDRKLTIALERTRSGKGKVKVGPATVTTGHAPWCVQVPEEQRRPVPT